METLKPETRPQEASSHRDADDLARKLATRHLTVPVELAINYFNLARFPRWGQGVVGLGGLGLGLQRRGNECNPNVLANSLKDTRQRVSFA